MLYGSCECQRISRTYLQKVVICILYQHHNVQTYCARSCYVFIVFFFSSRRRHTRYWRDWSSDVCSSDLADAGGGGASHDEGDGRARASLARRLGLFASLDGRRVPRPHARAVRAARPLRPRSRVPRRPAHRRPPLGRRRCYNARAGSREGARRQEGDRSLRLGLRAYGRGAVPRRRRPLGPLLPRLRSRDAPADDRQLLRRARRTLLALARGGRALQPSHRLPPRAQHAPHTRRHLQGDGARAPPGGRARPARLRRAEHEGRAVRSLRESSTLTRVAIIDYGVGNLRSVEKAFHAGGADAVVTSDEGVLREAERLVLPGVGAFRACMEGLKARGFDRLVRERVAEGTPLFGVCVGMQMLFEESEELDRKSTRLNSRHANIS